MDGLTILRHTDELGRLVIPYEMREALKIIPKETVLSISMTNTGMTITKFEDTCVICGGKGDLVRIQKALVCGACRKACCGL